MRLHRPYLAANLSRKQLLEALRYHYALLRGCMSAEEFSLYLNTPGLQLAKLEGKNGEQFTLELTMMISMDKEGDSTILFRNSEGIPLAEITFTLCEYQGKRRCLLADCKAQMGIRASGNPECDESLPRAISQTPRDGSGLSVCQRLQVEQIIIAVSNETHIYRSLRYRDKEGKIHADYNAFWESVGGVCDAERHYRLPAQIARKEIAEIASKKRAEYRRRYEMLDAIQPAKWPRCFAVNPRDRAPATARVRTFFSAALVRSPHHDVLPPLPLQWQDRVWKSDGSLSR